MPRAVGQQDEVSQRAVREHVHVPEADHDHVTSRHGNDAVVVEEVSDVMQEVTIKRLGNPNKT